MKTLEREKKISMEEQIRLARWIIDNVRLKLNHISDASEEVFLAQRLDTVKWITDNLHLFRKT